MKRSNGATRSGSEYRLRIVWLATSPVVCPIRASPTSSDATASSRTPGVLSVRARARRGVSRRPASEPDRQAEPRQCPDHEAHAEPDEGPGGDGREDHDVEQVHSPGVSFRATVRKPVWATIR